MSTDRLKNTDVRALLRLVSRMHATPDPHARKRRMVEGLCALTGADCGVVAVTHVESSGSPPKLVSTVHYAPDGATEDCLLPIITPLHPAPIAVRDDLGRAAAGSKDGRPHPVGFEWAGSAPVLRRMRQLVSSRSLMDQQTTAAICLFRMSARSAAFTTRHQGLVDLFHQEVMWVYQPDLLLLSPKGRTLSPRERQTLEMLLTGMSEKQIAGKLKLSRNTIHHYVKSIHRHFDVSSRSELFSTSVTC